MKFTKIEVEDFQYILKNIEIEKYRGKTILVTGGTGFIAKYIIKTLLYKNISDRIPFCEIYALCRNKEKAEAEFCGIKKAANLHFLYQDVIEKISTPTKIDYIFHTASIATTSLFHKQPVDVLTANTIGTFNVLELARQQKSRVLFFSSGAVYGDIPKNITRITEAQTYFVNPLEIGNCYAESKRMGENMCVAYYSQYAVPTKIVRISHTYGPGIDLNDGHIYSDFVRNILGKTELEIRGNGLAVRPFCYIADAVIAFFKVMLQGQDGIAYNMANNRESYSIIQLADYLTNDVFKTENLSFKVCGGIMGSNHQQKVEIDIKNLERLGWKPQITVKDGFKRTVEHYRSLGGTS